MINEIDDGDWFVALIINDDRGHCNENRFTRYHIEYIGPEGIVVHWTRGIVVHWTRGYSGTLVLRDSGTLGPRDSGTLGPRDSGTLDPRI